MANTNLNVTPGSGASVNGYTTPDGDFNQAVVVIDPTTGKTASITDNGAGQESLNISGTFKEFSGLTGAAFNADLLTQTDVSAYRSISVHVTGTFVATAQVQFSNDGVDWRSGGVQSTSNLNNSLTPSINGAGLWEGPIKGRYVRVRITSYTSGTMNGVVELYTQPTPLHTIGAVITPSSSIGVTSPATGYYIAANGASGNLAGLNTAANTINGGNVNQNLAVATGNYNGSTTDLRRGNEDVSLLASAARTTTQTSADLVNYNGVTALVVYLDVTVPGTGSVTVSINRKDPASGKYVSILTGAAVTTASTNVYKIGPSLVAVANSIAQDYLGRTFQIVVTANNANTVTYSVGYSLIRS